MTIIQSVGVTTLVALMSAQRETTERHRPVGLVAAEATEGDRCRGSGDPHRRPGSATDSRLPLLSQQIDQPAADGQTPDYRTPAIM
jgi:hypothetical protein